MKPHLVVVVGATGTQGGSVVNSILKDPNFAVRGLSRNPESDAAKSLKAQGAEIVKADLNDGSSLLKAFEGAYAIFAVTNFFEPAGNFGVEEARTIEYQQAINMVKAAKKTPTLQRYIWSTLPNSSYLSKGKYNVHFFDIKSSVDDYIRQDEEFLAKTTFVYFANFASNMFYPNFLPIYVKSASKYIQMLPADPEMPIWSMGDAKVNIGVFVRSVLRDTPKTGGTYVLCAVDKFTLQSYLAKWGEATGFAKEERSTAVIQISLDNYRSLWPGNGDLMGEMLGFWDLLRENSWVTPLGTKPMRAQALMTEDEQNELQSTAEGFRIAAAKFQKLV
ncbi:NmrA-like family-domain-containing protein [Penicillium riverlandense]|uniref:NmrA-like family-domain-containing protein n=1 Tax=Penicillium riverlandense TaxID=1903569 RepID=UPI0025486C11|nr:NmrA-like family-domain-containing protein [Penicillium riverlandense]KAJ5811734.1 NmrA-like family-domain-containing protein [Penicillium riverlandense]